MSNKTGPENPMYGKSHSEESKRLMSQKKSGVFDGVKNPMFGKTHSDEAKQKVADARLGKVWIFKDMTTKSVDKNELDHYLQMGWIRGRAMDKRASKNYLMKLIT